MAGNSRAHQRALSRASGTISSVALAGIVAWNRLQHTQNATKRGERVSDTFFPETILTEWRLERPIVTECPRRDQKGERLERITGTVIMRYDAVSPDERQRWEVYVSVVDYFHTNGNHYRRSAHVSFMPPVEEERYDGAVPEDGTQDLVLAAVKSLGRSMSKQEMNREGSACLEDVAWEVIACGAEPPAAIKQHIAHCGACLNELSQRAEEGDDEFVDLAYMKRLYEELRSLKFQELQAFKNLLPLKDGNAWSEDEEVAAEVTLGDEYATSAKGAKLEDDEIFRAVFDTQRGNSFILRRKS